MDDPALDTAAVSTPRDSASILAEVAALPVRAAAEGDGGDWRVLLSSPTQLTPSLFWRIICKWTVEPAYKQIHKVDMLSVAVRSSPSSPLRVLEGVSAPQSTWYSDPLANSSSIGHSSGQGGLDGQTVDERVAERPGEAVYARHLYPKDYLRKSEMQDHVRHVLSWSCPRVQWSHACAAQDLPYYYVHVAKFQVALEPLSEEEQRRVVIAHKIQQPAKKGEARLKPKPPPQPKGLEEPRDELNASPAPVEEKEKEKEKDVAEEPREGEDAMLVAEERAPKRAREQSSSADEARVPKRPRTRDDCDDKRAEESEQSAKESAPRGQRAAKATGKNSKRAREQALAGEEAAIDFDGSPFLYRLVFSAQLFDDPAHVDLNKLRAICRFQLQTLNRWGNSERNGHLQLPKAVKQKQLKAATASSPESGGPVHEAGYVKRVQHDVVVSRDAFTAHYRRLKERYGEWVSRWEEATDPRKFVFEDLGIAAFLLALWDAERDAHGLTRRQSFVDLGAGNGFLVYVLMSEGHPGRGVDLQRRKIWALFPDDVQAQLVEEALRPLETPLAPVDWLVANHSDELTPWVPVLAARTRPPAPTPAALAHTRYFVLPCCEWDFDRKYQRASNLSRYEAYLAYVASIGAALGHVVETEHLRIPSTRNIAQVCRTVTPTRQDGTLDVDAAIAKLLSDAKYANFVPKLKPGADHRK